MYHIMYAPKQNRHPLLFYLMIYKYKPSPGETSLKPGGKTEIWGFIGAVHLDMSPWSSSESRQMLWTVLIFLWKKNMNHGSIINFLGGFANCQVVISPWTPAAKGTLGGKAVKKEADPNAPPMNLKFVSFTVAVFGFCAVWCIFFFCGMLRSDYNSLQGDWHE